MKCSRAAGVAGRIVLEGFIHPTPAIRPATRRKVPSAIHGYYKRVERFPVSRSSASPAPRQIYHSTYSGRPTDPRCWACAERSLRAAAAEAVSHIADFLSAAEGCHRLAVVSIKKQYRQARHVRRVGLSRQFMYQVHHRHRQRRDVRDWKEVVWALSTRVDAARDTLIVENTPNYLDFASPVADWAARWGSTRRAEWPGETQHGCRSRWTSPSSAASMRYGKSSGCSPVKREARYPGRLFQCSVAPGIRLRLIPGYEGYVACE